MEQIKILLVDDHQIVRDGLRSLLKEHKNIFIVAEAQNGEEAIEILKKIHVDIVIMDISMPGMSGIETAQEIMKLNPDARILFLSMFLSEEFVLNAVKAGAKGYLAKNTTSSELVEAIVNINSGKEYFSEDVSKIILRSYISSAKEDEGKKNKLDTLTKREIEILKLFAEGSSNQEIAELLFISIRTVESHKTHIMQKLELKSTVELIKFAIKNNIVEL